MDVLLLNGFYILERVLENAHYNFVNDMESLLKNKLRKFHKDDIGQRKDMEASKLFNEMADMLWKLDTLEIRSYTIGFTELFEGVEKFRNEPHPIPWCANFIHMMGQDNVSLKKADTNARFCIVCGNILDPTNTMPTCGEKCSGIALNRVNVFSEAIELLEYFVDRVDKGSIRSKTTYKIYKEFLTKIGESK